MIQNKEIKYPVGIQSFEKIRNDGYLYVDKTPLLNQLISKKGYYFLSRPRRFGKSLFLSTLEAYYLGKRELFKGLALDSLTDDWEPHPVLHLDLNNREYIDESSLLAHLDAHLSEWEGIYGNEKKDKAPEERFAFVIKKAYDLTGKKVVILVDEYDKPLLNAIHDEELADIYRSQLKAFYSNLKTMDPYIEIAVLTGVARFSKVSIFSDLNNLNDISFDNAYAAICGITSEELDQYFHDGIADLAEEMECSPSEVREELRRRYDGYHFTTKSPDIYNPFSLMNVFSKKEMDDYWFSSGTPQFLYALLKRQSRPFKDIAPTRIQRRTLTDAGLFGADPIPILYQTGYLTIKKYEKELKSYILDYPNEEVRHGFLDFLLMESVPEMTSMSGFSIPDFLLDIRNGRPEQFMKRMESLVASIPYSEKGSSEDHFRNAVYLLFSLLGFYTRMEDRTSDGRIDLQVETPRFCYIFEFKIDSSAKAAMEQILDKRYWLRESCSGKTVFLIGANFDSSTARLADFLIQQPSL